jgi:putative membrane protein
MNDSQNAPVTGPVLIQLDTPPTTGPEAAPPLPGDQGLPHQTRTMHAMIAVGARRMSIWARLFWGTLICFLGLSISLAVWTYITDLLAARPVLGQIVTVLIAVMILCLLLLSLREITALFRLRRLDRIRRAAAQARSTNDTAQARAVLRQLNTLYAARDDLARARDTLQNRQGDAIDAKDLLMQGEMHLIGPIDAAALREVETALRHVATVTALVPIAFADIATALFANLRMIRRIAELYGGRAGTFGTWRLIRAVLAHLVATGAVALGDDLLGSALGGSVLSKLSRRFGEGVINGALTARVGIAAIEICRPLPFIALDAPKTSGVIKRGLAGMFQSSANV